MSSYEDLLEKIRPQTEKYGTLVDAFERCDFGNKAFDLDRVKMSSFLKGKICVKGDCSRCKMRNECRYAKYKKAAVTYDCFDFQVTNHNMYLTEIKINGMDDRMILRPSAYVIVDEAHKFHEVAQIVFGEQLTESAIPKYLTSVKFLCGVNTCKDTYDTLLLDAYHLNEFFFEKLRMSAYITHADEEGIHLISMYDDLLGVLAKMYATVKQIEHLRRKSPAHDGVSATSSNEYTGSVISIIFSKSTGIFS